MTIKELEKALKDAITGFSNEIHVQYSEDGNKPVTESDLHEVARQAFYAMSAMNEAVVKYLREASRG